MLIEFISLHCSPIYVQKSPYIPFLREYRAMKLIKVIYRYDELHDLPKDRRSLLFLTRPRNTEGGVTSQACY